MWVSLAHQSEPFLLQVQDRLMQQLNFKPQLIQMILARKQDASHSAGWCHKKLRGGTAPGVGRP